MSNTIMYCGETIDIGRCSQGEPFMRMDDVAEWFRNNVH